jgi:hypothetical protein
MCRKRPICKANAAAATMSPAIVIGGIIPIIDSPEAPLGDFVAWPSGMW